MGKKFLLLVALLITAGERLFLLPIPFDWRILYVLLIVYSLMRYGRKNDFLFDNIVKCSIVVLAASDLHAAFIGTLPISVALRNCVLQLAIILYYPLSNYIREVGVEKFNLTIELMALFASFLLLLVANGYIALYEGATSEREEGLRAIVAPILISWGVLIVIDKYMAYRKPLYLFEIIPMLAAILLVVQTRSVSMALATAIMSYFVFRLINNSNMKLSVFRYAGVALALVFIYFAYGYVSEMIENSLAIEEASSVNRLAAYSYYWTVLLENPIWGIGSMEAEFNKIAYNGVLMKLYTADIGLVGALSMRGFGILLCLIAYTRKIYKVAKSNILVSAVSVFLLALLPFNAPFNSPETTFYFILFLVFVDVTSQRYSRI